MAISFCFAKLVVSLFGAKHERGEAVSDKADVVVIGGGVIGSAIAYNLAKAGYITVLLEKNELASAASGGNLGQISLFDRWEDWHISLALESLDMYRFLAHEFSIDYQETGGIIALATEEQEEIANEVIEQISFSGIKPQILRGKEVNKVEPYLDSDSVRGIVHCPREGRLDPFAVTLMFIELGKKYGLKVYNCTEVVGFKFNGSVIKGVLTSKGEINTDLTINAAGSWAGVIAKMAGVSIPLKYHHGTAMVSQPVPRVIYGPVVGGGFLTREMLQTTTLRIGLSAVQTGHGSIIIGQATEEKELNKKDVTIEGFQGTASKFIRHFPKLSNLEIIRVWTAVTPYTQDGLPVCGFSSKVPNLLTVAGFKGAFTTAPAIGAKVADIVKGKSKWSTDLFSPDRV